jgi:hypothetical protein
MQQDQHAFCKLSQHRKQKKRRGLLAFSKLDLTCRQLAVLMLHFPDLLAEVFHTGFFGLI